MGNNHYKATDELQLYSTAIIPKSEESLQYMYWRAMLSDKLFTIFIIYLYVELLTTSSICRSRPSCSYKEQKGARHVAQVTNFVDLATLFEPIPRSFAAKGVATPIPGEIQTSRR